MNMMISYQELVRTFLSYKWVKPDFDDEQADIDETYCKARALKDLPPDNLLTGAYQKRGKKGNTDDITFSSSDANEVNRNILVKNCMYQKGWKQIAQK
ncbi:hypothetical protein [Klebsiella pneumoniae]|uniref:hypothetical protein n=1 Tax=Klebsiella pneumoniae TaxID=573 RepID=UPI002F9628DD